MIIRGFEDLKEKPVMESKQRAQWARQVKIGFASASQPSPLYLWYQEEDAKRRQGLKNEIDINEIISASKGVRNRWFERVKKNPDLYRPVIDGKECDWAAVLNG